MVNASVALWNKIYIMCKCVTSVECVIYDVSIILTVLSTLVVYA